MLPKKKCTTSQDFIWDILNKVRFLPEQSDWVFHCILNGSVHLLLELSWLKED